MSRLIHSLLQYTISMPDVHIWFFWFCVDTNAARRLDEPKFNQGYRSHESPRFYSTHPEQPAKLTHQSLMKNERRQNERLYHHAEVQIITKTYDSITAYTINLSDGGMLLKFQYQINFKVGDILNIQSQIFPEAPIKKVIVRRVPDNEKIGVEFI